VTGVLGEAPLEEQNSFTREVSQGGGGAEISGDHTRSVKNYV